VCASDARSGWRPLRLRLHVTQADSGSGDAAPSQWQLEGTSFVVCEPEAGREDAGGLRRLLTASAFKPAFRLTAATRTAFGGVESFTTSNDY
jgi:hypothetical protein